MEDEQNSSIGEVAPQDSESNVVDTSLLPEENQQVSDSHEVDDKQDRNWKEARRMQREQDIKIKAQDEMIEKLLNAKNAQPVPVQEIVPDEVDLMAGDDFLTKDQSDRRNEKSSEAVFDRKYKEYEARREQGRFMERLKSEYSDFTDVVHPESIAILEQKVPKLAETIAELKDPYKMGLQTYHYLKAMNLEGEMSKKRHAQEVEKKIEKNENSVQSPQAFNKRPMAQAFQSSEADMSKLYEEMMGFARQAGSGY